MNFPTTTAEQAIIDWIKAGTGLAAGQVIWDGQNEGAPTGQYVSVLPLALDRQGRDWELTEANPASTGLDGVELIHKVQGPRFLTLSIQCFGGPVLGSTSPMGRLEQLGATSDLPDLALIDDPTPAEILRAGGLALADFGPIQSVGRLINTINTAPRAAVTALLNLTSEVSKLGSYIETVLMTGTVDDYTVDTVATIEP